MAFAIIPTSRMDINIPLQPGRTGRREYWVYNNLALLIFPIFFHNMSKNVIYIELPPFGILKFSVEYFNMAPAVFEFSITNYTNEDELHACPNQ